MNREIKFRAWDGKRMHEWDDEFFSDTSEVTQFSGLFSDIKMNLMQFTGLLDKNGVEIYEGDICNFTNPFNETEYIRVVRFCQMFAGFGLYPNMDEKWNYESDWLKITNIIVIGNIYQNPKLLTSNTTQS